MSLPTPTHTTPTDVWAGAPCRDKNPELWFPAPSDLRTTIEAKRICGGCPLQLACLEFGMHAEYGIWGGLDEHERRALRRGNRQPPHAKKVA